MSKCYFLFLCALFLPLFGHASKICGNLGTYEDVLRCAEERAPEVQRAFLETEQAKARIGAAGQWQNPEVSVESVSGKVGGEKRGETELGVGIPIELGGKISSRKAVATGSASLAEVKLVDSRLKARTEALLKLHRLRQILHEQEVIDESITTFSKLISQYASRKGLSPEQAISASVFRMAKSEYDLKKVENQDELSTLESYFKLAIGEGLERIRGILPPSPKTWPKIATSFSPGMSLAFKAAQAELSVAEAELDLAKGDAWPTVTLGPSMKIEREGEASHQSYGFNLSLPLPLFSLNGGNKAAAKAGVKLLEVSKSIALVAEDSTRSELMRIYERSTAVLAMSLSHQEIEKKHSEVERLFLRGIVPSSLVIEAHRTFVELETSRNERELKALSALANIYALEGKKLEMN